MGIETKTKAEIVEVYKEQGLKLKEKNKEVDNLQSQMNNLQKMFEAMLSSQGNQTVEPKENIESKMVYVGTAKLGKLPLMIDGKDVILYGNKSALPFTIEEASGLVKSRKYRKLIEDGILYFEDEKWYKYFRVGSKLVLSEKNVIELLEKESEEMMKEIREITENGKNFTTMHSTLFRIAKILQDNKVKNLNMDNYEKLEDYFKMKLSTAKKMLEYIS